MKSIYNGFTKKTLLAILIVHFSMLSFAATYYVSSMGNDSNSGLTTSLAWKTLAKVNATNFKSGDQILFQKGNTFYGTLTIKNSGVSGSPITFGAYGTGANPIITGFTALSGWTNEGSGLYSKVISSEARTNMVIVNGVQVAMGRTPDNTYNTYESASTNVSITDTGLGDSPNWTGAEVVIRKNNYHLDRCIITNHTGDNLTYTSLGGIGNGTAGFGYFIQNDIRCVTATNEWFHDYTGTGKIYIYGDPSAKTIKVATLSNLIYNNGYDYIHVENLDLVGSISDAIHCATYSNGWTINNCNIKYAGNCAIYAYGTSLSVTNNVINHCNASAVYSSGGGAGTSNTITGNSISDIAVIVGQAYNSQYDYSSAIYSGYGGTILRYNTIKRVGYNGIFVGPYASTIQYNFVDSCGLVLVDVGGIYLTDATTSVRTIDHNIVVNTIGNMDGTAGGTKIANGIYLDDYCNNVVVTNNTIANCMAGIHVHFASDNTMSNNTIYNTDRGFWYQNNAATNYITGNIMNSNKIIAKSTSQFVILFDTQVNAITSFGTSDNNYYAKPIDDDGTKFWTKQPSTGIVYRTLATWQSFSGQDANSQKSPQAITNVNDLQFAYNETSVPKLVTLNSPSIDIEGLKYTGSVTLQPYTSIVLMKDISVPSDVTAPIVSAYSIPSTSTSLTVPISALIASDNIGVTGYLLTETSSTPSSSASGWSTTKPTTYVFTAIGTKTLYAWAKDEAGNVSTSLNATIMITSPVASTFTFTGPSSGNVNSTSVNFTIAPNNPYTGTITITPEGTGSAGLSTIVLTFSNSATAQTFTFIPTVAGNITLTPTNNGTLINPASLTYAVNAMVPNAPTSVFATAGNASASVSFVTPTSNGGSAITGYTVTSIPAGGIDTNAGSTSLTHIITGLINGTSYSFTAKATNSVGNSLASLASNSVIPKAPTATAFTFTGPSSGSINSVSSNFTVTPNNPYTGTITITPTGTGSAGLSSTVLTFSNSSAAQTFTITPIVAGSIILTPTNNGTLSNPANLTYTVNAVVPNAPTSIVATSGDTNASVTFVAPINTGGSAITGYTVTSIPSGGTDTNAGSTALTHIITGLTNGVSYTFTVKATNSVGSSLASDASNAVIPVAASVIIKQGEIVPSHFTTVWQGLNGLNHMNINVVSALLEDLPLSVDDEIAVFSGTACVGTSKLIQSIVPGDNSTFVTILASQNDGSGNGFIDNDTIVFKIWNSKTQNEFQVNAVVYRNDVSTWKTNGRYSPGATTVVEIASYQVYTQSIELLKGYNMISTYVSVQNPNVSAVTKTLLDQGNLIKMQDETGNSFENWGTFGGWINQLGSLEETEGYKIQVANNCILQVTGRSIAMPFDISLKTGWNIISFPRTDMINAMNVVQALIDQNKLVKVQDEAGNSIENWGIFGGWKNGIGNFIPGKAYKVKMSADAILTFQESYPKSALAIAKSESTEYYHSSVEGNGTDHMNINITGLNNIGLSAGDELAAFDGAVCVATTKITEANLLSGSASLVSSFSTDNQNPNGFKVGDSIQILAWNKLSGDESKVNAEVITGQLKYENNASVLVQMKSATIATGITNLDDVVKIDVFPNPCQGQVTVRFSKIPEENSRIEISDISGRKLISRLVSGTSEEFNLDSFTPGLYVVKSILGSREFVQKLIVNK